MKILHLEDNLDDAELVQRALHDAGIECEITLVQTRTEFMDQLARPGWDLILADYSLPGFDGVSALKIAAERNPGLPFIFVTGTLGEEVAVETLKVGASDYVVKHRLARLAPVVLRARREADLLLEQKQSARQLHCAEEALRDQESQSQDSEARYRNLVESIEEYAIVRLNLAGQIVSWTPAAERIKGYRAAEILGKHFSCFYTPEDIARKHPEEILTIAATVGRINEEGIRVRKDGSTFWANVSISAIRDEKRELRGFSKVTRDVTEPKRVEDLLVVTSLRAEQASQAKSDFLAAVSHEIRTPMNSILGMADVLSESNLDAEQRQCVEVFRRQGANLMTLIDNILDLAKIEAGRLDLEQTDFQLRALIDQIVELMASKAQAKGIRLRTEVAPEIARWFSGDATRLRQVLINLLGNAVKFTSSGEVLLTAEPVGHGRSSIEFRVVDTGIGIPANQLASIFEDFNQGDASITRKYGGTGLGLAISRRLVDRLGGLLCVTSAVGQGTTFRFTLPFQSASNAHPEHRDLAQDPCAPWAGVILGSRACDIVTEGPTIRGALESLGLVPRESPVDEAGFQSFVRECGQHGCSLVFVDRWVAGRDGFDITSDIRRLHPRLPIVMLTSDTSRDALDRRAEGLSGLVAKPVTRPELLRVLSRTLEPSRPNQLKTAAQESLATMQPLRNERPLRVLIVEDSLDNRLLLQMYLKGAPHTVTFVENGQEALDIVTASEFDIVLMDLQMPVMDGLTATRKIRAIERTFGRPTLPILALSANAGPEDIKLSLEAGCNTHLAKPISKRFLLAALEQYTKAGSHEPGDDMAGQMALLVPPYLNSQRRKCQELPTFLAGADFGAIRQFAHNLKGTGASYGFPGLSALGQAMQASADAADAEALSRQIHQLNDTFENLVPSHLS